MVEKYKIVRSFLKGESKVMKRGLTLKEAQEHCKDPETSHSTCTKPDLKEYTMRVGPWFDGYDKE